MSITALSVQIFTVPTLVRVACVELYGLFQVSNGYVSSLMLTSLQARQLIEEASVIKVIVDTVMELLREHLDASNHFFFHGHSSDKFSRIQLIFNDLRSLIRKQINPSYLLS